MVQSESMISLWIYFCLDYGEVMGSQYPQLFGSKQSGVCALWAASSWFIPPGVSFRIYKPSQRTWLRISSLVLEEELKSLTSING